MSTPTPAPRAAETVTAELLRIEALSLATYVDSFGGNIPMLTRQHCMSLAALIGAAGIALAAAEATVAELRGALVAYVAAHGNRDGLSHDMCEVEMFRAFLRATKVLGISATPAASGPSGVEQP